MATGLFKFGVVADVQYADSDDAPNFSKTRTRRYRNALKTLQEAVPLWDQQAVSFVAQLGDLLDGRSIKGADEKVMADVINQSGIKDKWLHVVGNHELYCFSRAELEPYYGLPNLRSLSLNPELLPISDWRDLYEPEAYATETTKTDMTQSLPIMEKLWNNNGPEIEKELGYYDFSPKEGWRVITIDCFDISAMSKLSDGTVRNATAKDLLQTFNHNFTGDIYEEVLKNPRVDWKSGLNSYHTRWVPFNGGVGPRQLEWLQSTIEYSHQNKEKVIMLVHVPISPYGTGTDDMCLVWNFQPILRLLHDRPGTVVAVFAGHMHDGGYGFDPQSLTHHITFPAPLECEVDQVAFATVECFDDGSLHIDGAGRVPTFDLPFGRRGSANTNFTDASLVEAVVPSL